MQTEHSLNAAQSPEEHAISCWAALERHAAIPPFNGRVQPARCGCYQHSITRHIVTLKSCEVGEALAEEYEIASRRVREIQAAQTLESGDFEQSITDEEFQSIHGGAS